MSNIQKTDNKVSTLIELLHNNHEIKPFLEDVYLTTVYVAGLFYIGNIDEIFPKIKKGDRLELFLEKNNPNDCNAILVKYCGEKIGYVPRSDNVILANLMDVGKLLYGVVLDASIGEVYDGDDLKMIKFKIFLKE